MLQPNDIRFHCHGPLDRKTFGSLEFEKLFCITMEKIAAQFYLAATVHSLFFFNFKRNLQSAQWAISVCYD
jgi:hypothetical protein